MTTTTPRNPEARLAPLTGAEYIEINAQDRQHDPATCPCCGDGTEQGWLDDQGCCYRCSIWFDRPVRDLPPPPPPIEVRLVNRGGRLLLTGLLD